MKSSLVLGLLLLATTNIHAIDIKGKVTDAQTGEEIIGASILIKKNPVKVQYREWTEALTCR